MRTALLYKHRVDFERWVIENHWRKTADKYLKALEHILDAMPWVKFPRDITRPDVIQYIHDSKNKKPHKVDFELSVLRQFYSFMREAGVVDYNPVEHIPKLAPWKHK